MRPWRPVLDGAAATEAANIIQDLIAELALFEANNAAGLERSLPYSLGWGDAGVAVFYSYAYRYIADPKVYSMAEALFRKAICALATERMVPDLFRGLAGIGWSFEHIACRMNVWESSEESCVELDELLTRFSSLKQVTAEFMEGVAGICLYAATRNSYQSGQELLQLTVNRLEETALQLPRGRAWEVSTRIRSELARHYPEIETSNAPIFKTSVAHGVSGVIGALASVISSGFETPSTRSILHGAVEWLLAQRRTGLSQQIFPEFVGQEKVPQLTTGWCSGDIGISVVLFNTARAVKGRDWEAEALSIARREAKLTAEDVEAHNRRNYAICHGSAGRLHLFNRLFQATGDPIFKSAARYWAEYTLSLKKPGHGIGGFLVEEPKDGGSKTLRGLLMGAAGLGLVLLASITSIEPQWDQLLLASLFDNGH